MEAELLKDDGRVLRNIRLVVKIRTQAGTKTYIVDSLDTAEGLEENDRHAKEYTVAVASSPEKVLCELPKCLVSANETLALDLLLRLKVFILNIRVVGRKLSNRAQALEGLLIATFRNEPTRSPGPKCEQAEAVAKLRWGSLGAERSSNQQDGSRNKLDEDWELPLETVGRKCAIDTLTDETEASARDRARPLITPYIVDPESSKCSDLPGRQSAY